MKIDAQREKSRSTILYLRARVHRAYFELANETTSRSSLIAKFQPQHTSEREIDRPHECGFAHSKDTGFVCSRIVNASCTQDSIFTLNGTFVSRDRGKKRSRGSRLVYARFAMLKLPRRSSPVAVHRREMSLGRLDRARGVSISTSCAQTNNRDG